jgi:glyoxylase-like metal-dependent hydrolase (beta-lactamase superfamily II)
MKIIDNVYVVPGVRGHAYLVVDADGLTLIDTGLPGSHKQILDYIAGLGKSARDLKRIILTHADLDHVGGLTPLHQASGARTYASQIEADAIAAGKPSRPIRARGFIMRRLMFAVFGPFMKPKPFQVDEILTDGQVLPALGGLRVVDTAGHTPGHVSLYAPAVGVLFCGDSMVTEENVIHGSRPGLTWDDARAREAERKQAALGARIVCSGHGPVVMDAAGKFPV